jgi:hypothetical protein
MVTINGVAGAALLDTGAGRDYVSDRYFQELGLSGLTSRPVKVSLGDNSSVAGKVVAGPVPLQLTPSLKVMVPELTVLPEVHATDAVIGRSTLRAAGIELAWHPTNGLPTAIPRGGPALEMISLQKVFPTLEPGAGLSTMGNTNAPLRPYLSFSDLTRMLERKEVENIYAFDLLAAEEPVGATAPIGEELPTIPPSEATAALSRMEEPGGATTHPIARTATSKGEELPAIPSAAPPELRALVTEFADIFGEPRTLPPQRGVEHTIRLKPGSELPPPSRVFRLAPAERAEIQRQLDDLLTRGFVSPSAAATGAATFLVKKKDGSHRLVIDYRPINAITVPDGMPMPEVDGLLDEIAHANVVSTLDLTSGYWQVGVEKRSQPLTTFRTSAGAYYWRVLPFGLSTAPATFTRAMKEALGDLDFAHVYLDDILIASEDVPTHLKHLRHVFERLRRFRLQDQVQEDVPAPGDLRLARAQLVDRPW